MRKIKEIERADPPSYQRSNLRKRKSAKLSGILLPIINHNWRTRQTVDRSATDNRDAVEHQISNVSFVDRSSAHGPSRHFDALRELDAIGA